MRVGLGLVVVLALVAVLAFGLTGTSAAPAVAPSGNAVVDSRGVAATDDTVSAEERLHSLVGSSGFTQLAE